MSDDNPAFTEPCGRRTRTGRTDPGRDRRLGGARNGRAARRGSRAPRAEERAAYAKRLRHRRLADTFDEGEQMIDEWGRRGLRLGREGQLAAEGAIAPVLQVVAPHVRRARQGGPGVGGGDRAAEPPPARPARRRGRLIVLAEAARGVPCRDGPTRSMRTLFRHPRRLGHVLAVFMRLFIAPALGLPGADKRPGPVRLRLALEQLGGAWVKLGQMLALRYDLLPVAYCDELFGLLNQVAPFSYDEVRGIIRQELGAEPEVVFASFDRTVVRVGVDRPGPPRHAAQRGSRRGQGPAARASARPSRPTSTSCTA